MRLSFAPLALVICVTSMAFRPHLRRGDDVQTTVQLAIAAHVKANRLTAPTRAGHWCNAGTHRECVCIAAVSEIAGVPEYARCHHRRDAPQRQQAGNESFNKRAELTLQFRDRRI